MINYDYYWPVVAAVDPTADAAATVVGGGGATVTAADGAGDVEPFVAVAGGENERLTLNGDAETWIDGDAFLGTTAMAPMSLFDSYYYCTAAHAVDGADDEPWLR